MKEIASAIFAISVHNLTVTFRDKSAYIWVFVGPALCMALAGFLTSPQAGNAPVLKIAGRGNPRLTTRVAKLLERDGNRVEIVDSVPTAEFPTVEVIANPLEQLDGKTSIVLHGGSQSTQGERALRLELEDVLARLRVEDLSKEKGVGRSPDIRVGKIEGRGFRVPVTGYQRSVPAFLLMFMTINLLVAGANLAEDRAAGRLRRISLAPVAGLGLVGGMLVARVVLAWTQTVVLVLVGVVLFHIRWAANPAMVAVFIAVYATALGGIGLFIGTWVENAERANAVAVWLGIIIAPLSGLWWPVDSMGGFMQTVSSLLPTSWALRALSEMLSFGGSSIEVAAATGGLLIIAVITIGLTEWKLSRAPSNLA